MSTVIRGVSTMRGSRLLHVTKCKVCHKDADVTIPTPGDHPEGFCLEHLTDRNQSASLKGTAGMDMDLIFASLLNRAA